MCLIVINLRGKKQNKTVPSLYFLITLCIVCRGWTNMTKKDVDTNGEVLLNKFMGGLDLDWAPVLYCSCRPEWSHSRVPHYQTKSKLFTKSEQKESNCQSALFNKKRGWIHNNQSGQLELAWRGSPLCFNPSQESDLKWPHINQSTVCTLLIPCSVQGNFLPGSWEHLSVL